MPQVGVAGVSGRTYRVYISGHREQSQSNKTPLSARTCSDLVIENKSHPASNETPLRNIIHM